MKKLSITRQQRIYRVCELVTRIDPHRKLIRTGFVRRGNIVMSLRKAVNLSRRLNSSQTASFYYPIKTNRNLDDYAR